MLQRIDGKVKGHEEMILVSYDLLPDSPAVNMLRATATIEKRLPVCFHPVVRREMWAALGDYYVHAGGHTEEDTPVLVPLGEIVMPHPQRAMGLTN